MHGLYKKKGQYFLPFNERKVILENIAVVSEVIDFEDDEIGSAIKGLKEIKSRYPQDEIFFCNGGDRDKNNISEMALSGINFSFNVGGSVKKNSSSWILKEWSYPLTKRSWGNFYDLFKDDFVKVKELIVHPKQGMSFQDTLGEVNYGSFHKVNVKLIIVSKILRKSQKSSLKKVIDLMFQFHHGIKLPILLKKNVGLLKFSMVRKLVKMILNGCKIIKNNNLLIAFSIFIYNINPMAGWQSGYAAACKAVNAGSIPASASNI